MENTIAEGERYQSQNRGICKITRIDYVSQVLEVCWELGSGSIRWPLEEFLSRKWTLLADAATSGPPMKKGQTWRRLSDNVLMVLGERSLGFGPHPDSGFRLMDTDAWREGGWSAPDFRQYFAFVCDAPETTEPARPAVKESAKDTRLKCENNECETPFQNVAKRYCQSVDNNGIKSGAVLELSCEPCHLRDEEEWADRTGYVGDTGVLRDEKIAERIDRRLTHAAGLHDDDLIG